ncbi:MAG TPA: ribosome recycling factor [Candidatus Paceibacterota bacterium]
MTESTIKELEAKLNQVIGFLQSELQTVRTNRPSVGLLEDIKVEYYGQVMQIKQLASLSIRPPRDIEVNIWDKGAVAAVAKAIETAKAGFSVSNDGNIVRVSLPPLTDERRAEMTKLVKRMSEDARITVRGERDEANKKIKAAEDSGQATEDQVFKGKEQIQKITDTANKQIENLLNGKITELSE